MADTRHTLPRVLLVSLKTSATRALVAHFTSLHFTSTGAIACIRRLEQMEGVPRGRSEHPRQLAVPVHLLDICLPLVDEEELRGDVAQVVAPLDGRLRIGVLL